MGLVMIMMWNEVYIGFVALAITLNKDVDVQGWFS